MSESDKLVALFRQLNEADRQTLLSMAEFLLAQAGPLVPEVEHPLDIPRPEKETVIGAVKRLSKTYPMIDRTILFHDVSTLTTAHIMKGRSAPEVIDELQQLFADCFSRMK